MLQEVFTTQAFFPKSRPELVGEECLCLIIIDVFNTMNLEISKKTLHSRLDECTLVTSIDLYR
jgi:hypothetical protein